MVTEGTNSLPALFLNYNFCYFSIKKVNHSTKNLNTKLRTFPWFYRVSPIKFRGKSVKGFMSFDRTHGREHRQWEITTLYTYYIDNGCWHFFMFYIYWIIQALASKLSEEMDLVKGMPSNPAEKNWKNRRSQKLEKMELLNLQSNLQSEIQAKQEISQELSKIRSELEASRK